MSEEVKINEKCFSALDTDAITIGTVGVTGGGQLLIF